MSFKPLLGLLLSLILSQSLLLSPAKADAMQEAVLSVISENIELVWCRYYQLRLR